MVAPPSLDGAVHETESDEVVADPALTAVGVSGTCGPLKVVYEDELDEKGPYPTEFFAATLKM